MIKISSSILSSDFAHLGKETRAMCQAGCDYIHIDVMDGYFVPNITIGAPIVSAIKPYATKPLDVHLMIRSVDAHIDAFAMAGADIITFHPEASPNPHQTIETIKNAGCKIGIALNPETNLSTIDPFLEYIDLVLVMSVYPGRAGQKFITKQLGQIKTLRNIIDMSYKNIELSVDGGINNQTAPQVIEAGASILVTGTASFAKGSDYYAENIRTLKGINKD